MEDSNAHNNSEFIYKYTESSIEQIHKSIDIVTGKLTTVIGFSGVLLKFAADMPSNDFQFVLKVGVSICLIFAIGLCGTGIAPQSRGPVVSPDFLLEAEQYRTTEEEVRLIIIKRWIKSAPTLMEVRNRRIKLLQYAIGMLIAAGFLFGLSNILSNIH